jgi:hypothetical protein
MVKIGMPSQEQAKVVGDVVAGSVTAAALMSWITPLAALASLVYACLRIYEWLEARYARRS